MILSDEAHAANIARQVRTLNLALEAAYVDGLAVDMDVHALDVRSIANGDRRLVQLQAKVARPIECE